MAHLADIDLEYAEVDLPNGKSFSVRGISLLDASTLINAHGDEVQAFFMKYATDRGAIKDQGVADVGLALLNTAPVLAAEVIAIAADAPDQATKVQKFPLGVQMEALEKIAKLSFDSEGGPKKFFEAVVRLLQGTTGLLNEFNQSAIGSLVSGAK